MQSSNYHHYFKSLALLYVLFVIVCNLNKTFHFLDLTDQFKISQVGTSNCLYETGGKIVLDNRCDDFFCENRLGYLMHVKKSECLRTSKVVKLNIDCSTIDADFTLNSNVSSNIWFRYSSGSPNCLVDNRKSIGLSSNPDDCIQVEKSSG